MKHKDLAEEYAIKEYEYINEENDLIFEDNKCFTFNDIKAAFNAGLNSVINNIPKLRWAKIFENGSYIAISSFGISYTIEVAYNEYKLFCNNVFINWYTSTSEAKDAANLDYKKRIKQALGI